jgi:hypothetical protein
MKFIIKHWFEAWAVLFWIAFIFLMTLVNANLTSWAARIVWTAESPGMCIEAEPVLASPTNAYILEAEQHPLMIPEVDEGELDMMAHLLCGECQTGSWEQQLAVGSVVLNRVKHKHYPNTIEGVIFQRRQYACTWDGNYYRKPTERNWQVAEYLLKNGSQIPPNVIFQAQFRQGHGVWKKIGTEIFCYE